MTGPSISILAFGAYLLVGGVLLTCFPSEVASLLRVSAGEGVWMFLTGMFFLLFANYCVRAALSNEHRFIEWTVWTRPLTIVFLGVLILRGLAPTRIIIFGIVDLAFSSWTALALRMHDKRSRQ